MNSRSGPIYLAKEGNRSSEQIFSVVVQIISASVPPNSGSNIQPATHNVDYRLSAISMHVTLTFLPKDQRINVPFTLFSDDVPEGTEAFHLSSAPDSSLPYLNPIHLTTDTFIIIEGNLYTFFIHCLS